MQLSFLALFLFAFNSFAHQTNLTGEGKPLKWTNKNVSLTIRNNSQTLSSSSSTQVIRNSISQWNQASTAKITEGSSATSEISFSQDFSVYGPAVVGMTELIYNESTGTIQKARILLNEDNFSFTANSGFQIFSNQIFLGDVVTHELGHFFGLSHSEVVDSTMFYSTFPGQSTIAADDKAGVRSKYDTGYGKITGYIKGGSNVGVLGTHIQVISNKTGEAIGAISKADGSFEVGGLDLNDSYYLYTSPIKKIDSLPGYFSNVQNSFCPANYVGSFFSSCGKEHEGNPQKIHLSSFQPQVNVGAVTINCSLRANQDYSYEKLQTNFQPVTIFDSSVQEQNHLGFVGYFLSSELSTTSFSRADKLRIDLSHFLDLSGNPKYLKVSLITQALGSPVEYAMKVKRNNVSLAGTLMKTVKSPEGTYKTDLSALVALNSNTTSNIYDLEIQGKRMTSEDLADTLPSAGLYNGSQHFPYFVMVSVWENSYGQMRPYDDTEVSLSDNRNCLDAPFTYAVSNSKLQTENSTRDKQEAAAVAGCGTIEPPKGGGPGSFPLMVFGFLMTFLASQYVKSRKNFLS